MKYMKQTIIGKYISPAHERSEFKGIPMEYLDSVRAVLQYDGIKYRIKYRGPRHDIFAATCLKKDARSFAVYFT